MKNITLLFIFSTLLIVKAAAGSPIPEQPTVKGGIISWPDNGSWYQVQIKKDDGIYSVCEGGTSCQVAPGNYIVINHTTGQRFEEIKVGFNEFILEYSIDGNIISFPDNGWYQVQDASTYEDICNGTRTCTVEAGNYILINHTTGDRFDNVVVGMSNDVISVSGNTISWPDDGWYQVQTPETHENICNGGRSCNVPNGIYRVINHTSGERFENIKVSVANQSNGEALFTPLLSGDLAFTEDLTFTEPRLQVIRSNEELNTLYFGSLIPYCPACEYAFFEYDFFDDSIAVLVAHEIVGSGGYGIEVSSTNVSDGNLTINVAKTAPGANCIVTDAFTGPYSIYKIDGLYDKVDFIETVNITDC